MMLIASYFKLYSVIFSLVMQQLKFYAMPTIEYKFTLIYGEVTWTANLSDNH